MAPSTRRQIQAGPSAADRQRHQDMIKLVFDWLRRTRGTQQLLVKSIEDFWRKRGEADYRCDHTLLSRILNPARPHVPTARRPKSMRILQAISVVCADTGDPNVIESASDDDAAWASDDEQAFKIHRARLRQLREVGRASLFSSLARIGEFCATARWMDDRTPSNELGETYRQRATENVLLALAALIDAGESMTPLRDRLVAEGVDRAQALRVERAQVARVDDLLAASSGVTVNMLGYAGPILLHCHERQRGFDLLLRAVADGHDAALRHDPHWETMLELLDRALSQGDMDANRWSRAAAELALRQLRENAGPWRLLLRAWPRVNVPVLTRHWDAAAPELLVALQSSLRLMPNVDTPPAPPTPTPRGNGAASKVKSLALAVALAASAWLGTSNTAPVYASADAGQQVERSLAALTHDADAMSIRGREAQGPPRQPPPGGPPTA